jgi:SMC interacting uncharacterized protein involved in chromosome segregation
MNDQDSQLLKEVLETKKEVNKIFLSMQLLTQRFDSSLAGASEAKEERSKLRSDLDETRETVTTLKAYMAVGIAVATAVLGAVVVTMFKVFTT